MAKKKASKRAPKSGTPKKRASKARGPKAPAASIRVGGFVADGNGQLFFVAHASDTTLALKDFKSRPRNVAISSVRAVAAPLKPGAKVSRGKATFTVVEQSYADAVLLRGADGAEIEASPKGLKIVSGGRYASKGTPAPAAHASPARATQATPAATQGAVPESDHGMVPVFAVSGGGSNAKPDYGQIGYARTKAQAIQLVSRFKFWGDPAKTMHQGERVYVAPVGDSKNGFDRAAYALERVGLSSRANPIRTPAGRVLEARGGRKLASKLLHMRQTAIANGEKPPQRIKRPGGGFLTYESASVILSTGGLRGNKNAIRPRKARETSPRRTAGDGGIAWWIRQQFGGE